MVYIIGYAGITLDKFLEVMQELKVSILIDVRSLPKSKYFYQFNDTNLSKALSNIGIAYEKWKGEFGARQENPFYKEVLYLRYNYPPFCLSLLLQAKQSQSKRRLL